MNAQKNSLERWRRLLFYRWRETAREISFMISLEAMNSQEEDGEGSSHSPVMRIFEAFIKYRKSLLRVHLQHWYMISTMDDDTIDLLYNHNVYRLRKRYLHKWRRQSDLSLLEVYM
jgi:hypothetical protein